MLDDNGCGRRKFLQASAVTGSGLLASGTVAASEGSSPDGEDLIASGDALSGKLKAENGRVVVDGSVPSYRGKDFSIRDVARMMNAEIKRGLCEPVEISGELGLKLTETGKRKVRQALEEHDLVGGEGPAPHDCDGVSKKTNDGVYLNDNDTGEVGSALKDVGFVTALAGIIAAVVLGITVIALIPAVIFAVAGYLIRDFGTDLWRHNDGCGVKIEDYSFVGWDVRGQDCDC